MRYIIVLLTIGLIPVLLPGQSQYKLNGRIVDAGSGRSLAGANVAIQGTTIGAMSDREGFFQTPALPAGRYTLEFSYVGYATHTREIDLNSDTTLIVPLYQTIIGGPIVTVTATQARERLSPVTFSNMDRAAIEARYTIQDIPEVISELPSTTFYSESGNGLGYNYLSIRGFDQRRISVMINGIPQNDPEDHNVYWLDFPDFASNVQSIQVQRGAGSAFYGPAAIGGSINILTNYFSPQREIKAFYGIGSFNTRKYSLSYNSGLLWDKMVFYARASRIQSDGYRERAWVNFWSYFLGTAFYTNRHSLRLHFYGGPIEDGLAYTGLPKLVNKDENLRRKNYSYWETNARGDSITYAADRRADEIENFNQPHFEILHEYKINSRMNLNNTFFFIRGYGFFDYDGGWVNYYDDAAAYFRLTPEYGYNDITIPWDALIRAYVDNQQWGWLPQITWKGDRSEIIGGAELRSHRSLHWGRLQKGSGLADELVGNEARHYYEYKGAKDIASAYVHLQTEIRPELYFMSDLQYSYKKYRLYDEKYVGTEFAIPYHFLNPRIGLNYNLTSRLHSYISLSRTTREPRLKNFYDAAESGTPASWGMVEPQFILKEDGEYNFDSPLVKPETLTGLEVGLGYQSTRFRASMNYYYMDFYNEIIKKGGVDRFGQPITGNAKRTLHQGVELVSQWQILPQFSINGNLTVGKNELVDYTVYDSRGSAMVLDGNPIAGFPDILANGRLSYAWKGTYLALDVRHAGKFYTDNFKNESNTVDAYTILNLTVRQDLSPIGLKGLVLQGRINNLLNKKYLAHGEGELFFPAALRNGFFNVQYEW